MHNALDLFVSPSSTKDFRTDKEKYRLCKDEATSPGSANKTKFTLKFEFPDVRNPSVYSDNGCPSIRPEDPPVFNRIRWRIASELAGFPYKTDRNPTGFHMDFTRTTQDLGQITVDYTQITPDMTEIPHNYSGFHQDYTRFRPDYMDFTENTPDISSITADYSGFTIIALIFHFKKVRAGVLDIYQGFPET
ncbi:unnamed protein product [Adineta ricciae]|uniref:Uncharacterized protein n=1 Tax=Adineta ricciae TaxID=249248 RepID=A0A814I3I0_ADIRI|nr:unnamed protein product [Adineta ricciae]